MSEILKPAENNLFSLPEVQKHLNLSLDRREIDALFENRLQDLEEIKDLVSLKFYYHIREKIEAEKEALLSLLNFEKKKKDILSDYSFALDTHYFEQKFLYV